MKWRGSRYRACVRGERCRRHVRGQLWSGAIVGARVCVRRWARCFAKARVVLCCWRGGRVGKANEPAGQARGVAMLRTRTQQRPDDTHREGRTARMRTWATGAGTERRRGRLRRREDGRNEKQRAWKTRKRRRRKGKERKRGEKRRKSPKGKEKDGKEGTKKEDVKERREKARLAKQWTIPFGTSCSRGLRGSVQATGRGKHPRWGKAEKIVDRSG